MCSEIGFVILSHRDPQMLKRLLSALDHTYRSPPVVVHHDFTQCQLPEGFEYWAKKVRFSRPHVKTSWAHISVVEAFSLALGQLYELASPKWFTLLSGSDYPVRDGTSVLRELRESGVDAFINLQEIDNYKSPLPSGNPGSFLGKDRMEWQRMAYDRYLAKAFNFPSLTKSLRPTRRSICVRNERILRFVSRFPAEKCFAGDHWFTANAKVAAILLRELQKSGRMYRYFADRFCPEESIYHTIIGNNDIRIANCNARYTKWSEGKCHPEILTISDRTALIQSNCHFARKMATYESDQLLKWLDRGLV